MGSSLMLIYLDLATAHLVVRKEQNPLQISSRKEALFKRYISCGIHGNAGKSKTDLRRPCAAEFPDLHIDITVKVSEPLLGLLLCKV